MTGQSATASSEFAQPLRRKEAAHVQSGAAEHRECDRRRWQVFVLYALALILIWVGGLKFAAYEAVKSRPTRSGSPAGSGWTRLKFGLAVDRRAPT